MVAFASRIDPDCIGSRLSLEVAYAGSLTRPGPSSATFILRRMAPQLSQGFITVTPHSWKSVTFRVAKAAPESRTMAAICASKWEIGLPVFRRSAAIRAYNGAASKPNGKIRPLKSFSNIAWAAASRLSRLRPWGSSNKPCSNYVKKPYCKNAR